MATKAAIGRVLLIVATISLLFIMHAFAQLGHPPQDMEIHRKFYNTWMMPNNRTLSCCSEHDCYPTEARMVDGHWQAKSRVDGSWLDVPDNKIERERDNPDGRNHVCEHASSKTVLCFIHGAGT